MKYVISDIHGCYDEYKSLLNKINFSENDELYVLGDTVDRGYSSIQVLKHMMMQPNIFPIMGNHDLIALLMLRKLCVKITEENAETHLSFEDIQEYMQWLKDGGGATVNDFIDLDEDEREDILEYFQEFLAYHEICVNEKRYILVHAGLNNFCENKKLEEYELQDLLFYRMDYGKRYFSDPDTYIVTGHTPTTEIRQDKKPMVYEENGHIAIDCGCVYGGQLAAYCLDTNEVFYVEGLK